jgi:hypothetical protein
MFKVQSVIIDNKKFDLQSAVNFLVRNNLKHNKVDKTINFWRFRQINPAELRREGYNKYVSKYIADGISFILAYKN